MRYSNEVHTTGTLALASTTPKTSRAGPANLRSGALSSMNSTSPEGGAAGGYDPPRSGGQGGAVLTDEAKAAQSRLDCRRRQPCPSRLFLRRNTIVKAQFSIGCQPSRHRGQKREERTAEDAQRHLEASLVSLQMFEKVPMTCRPASFPLAVRHRTIIAESDGGAVAVFPPPHQYLYPLDFSDNFGLVWHGRGFRRGDDWGFGVRVTRGRQTIRPMDQCPAGHPAAPGCVLPPEHRAGVHGDGASAPVHARRPL